MTDEVKVTANAARLHRPGRHALRTAVAAALRITLLAPLRLVLGLLWCVAAMADKLAEAVSDVERAVAPLCELPFHADAMQRLEEAKAEDRRKLLELMERATR